MRRRRRIWKFVPRNDYRIRLFIAICVKPILDFVESIPDSFGIFISDRSSSISICLVLTYTHIRVFVYSSSV